MTFDTFQKIASGSYIKNIGLSNIEFSEGVFHSLATMTDKPHFILVARNKHLNMKIGYTPFSALASFFRSDKEFFCWKTT